jgi:hypothetical protein
MMTEGCSMYAVRFQHGFLSRGGRRRSSPPGSARVEGISFLFPRRCLCGPERALRWQQLQLDSVKPPVGGFLLAARSRAIGRGSRSPQAARRSRPEVFGGRGGGGIGSIVVSARRNLAIKHAAIRHQRFPPRYSECTDSVARRLSDYSGDCINSIKFPFF